MNKLLHSDACWLGRGYAAHTPRGGASVACGNTAHKRRVTSAWGAAMLRIRRAVVVRLCCAYAAQGCACCLRQYGAQETFHGTREVPRNVFAFGAALPRMQRAIFSRSDD